jgi:hypothetical protein
VPALERRRAVVEEEITHPVPGALKAV